jgi:peroxiredoxin
MSLTKTPVCNFSEKIKNFSLRSTDEKQVTLADMQGSKGTLIMFICNHCPYVQAIMQETVEIVNKIKKLGISSVAIMSNDTLRYQEDSFDNMKLFKKKYNISFPYLFDDTQEIAQSYGAVCTPDFFGYNKDGGLQYRGRVRELKHLTPIMEKESELLLAMKMIASTNKGPLQQYPSMGCNIKWK